LRVTLSSYSQFDFVDFKFIIASDLDLSDLKEKCDKCFKNALKHAKVREPKLFKFELWDKEKLREFEIEYGLRIDE